MRFRTTGKKIAACIIGILMGLAGCGGPEMGTAGSDGNAGAAEEEKITIRLLIDEQNVPYYQEIVREMEIMFPEYHIISEPWEQMQAEKRVKTAFASGAETIDVVKWFPNQMGTFISSGMALDLTPYMDEEWSSIWSEHALEIGTYGGKLYSVPNTTVYPMIEVNEDIFRQAGVEVKERWNWQEFEDACQKIQERTGAFPFGIRDTRVCWMMRNAMLQVWPSESQTELFCEGEISFRNKRLVGALDKVNELFVRNYAYPGGAAAFSQTNEQIKDAFANGEIAMMFNVNSNGMQSLRDMEAAGWENIRIVNYPTMYQAGRNYILGGCDGYFIPSNTAHPDAAVKVLKYLTSKRVFQKQAEYGDVIPTKAELSGETTEEFSKDSARVYSREVMNLSSQMYDYINNDLASGYYKNKENALKKLEQLRAGE